MRIVIDGFEELRVGMPVVYIEETSKYLEPPPFREPIICHNARVEAVGWDWAVCRYQIDNEDYIELVLDLSTLRFEAEDEILDPNAPIQMELSIKERLALVSQKLHVKGIGDL